MKIPPYHLKDSQLKLTSHGGLMVLAHLVALLELSELVNRRLPTLKTLGNWLRRTGGSASAVV